MTTGKELASSVVVPVLATKPLLWLGSKVFHEYVPIFMLHRFACPEHGIRGHETSFLRWALEYLRKKRFNFVTVDSIAEAIRGGRPLPPRSVAFSLDDGYWDQAEEGGRLFAQFDCPATYYVTTGFINGENWFWDAKVEYVVEQSEPERLNMLATTIGTEFKPTVDRRTLASDLIALLKDCDISTMSRKIGQWATELQVEVPEKAPERDKPITWSRLRDLQRMGMKIGAHTYSHPILSNESDDMSRDEIRRSQDDLVENLGECSDVFCYPVGRDQDFGRREENFVEELGFVGAVSAVPLPVNQTRKSLLFSMPRFGFPNSKKNLIQYATYIEAMKGRLRA